MSKAEKYLNSLVDSNIKSENEDDLSRKNEKKKLQINNDHGGWKYY